MNRKLKTQTGEFRPNQNQLNYILACIEHMIENLPKNELSSLGGVSIATVNNWESKPEFNAWFDKEMNKAFGKHRNRVVSELVKTATDKTTKDVLDKDGNIRELRTDARDKIKAAELILKMTGDLDADQSITIDNRQQTLNAGNPLSLNDMVKHGFLTNDVEDKETVIKSEDEFDYEAFKTDIDSSFSGDNGNGSVK